MDLYKYLLSRKSSIASQSIYPSISKFNYVTLVSRVSSSVPEQLIHSTQIALVVAFISKIEKQP